jgi:uncharacterized membrane protein YgcG
VDQENEGVLLSSPRCTNHLYFITWLVRVRMSSSPTCEMLCGCFKCIQDVLAATQKELPAFFIGMADLEEGGTEEDGEEDEEEEDEEEMVVVPNVKARKVSCVPRVLRTFQHPVGHQSGMFVSGTSVYLFMFIFTTSQPIASFFIQNVGRHEDGRRSSCGKGGGGRGGGGGAQGEGEEGELCTSSINNVSTSCWPSA